MKRNILTILGFLLFIVGFVGIVVNMVGLPFAITDWMNIVVGPVIGFFVKILFVVIGIILTVLNKSNSTEDSFDEYFDGNNFK
jgi:hypothetical protein